MDTQQDSKIQTFPPNTSLNYPKHYRLKKVWVGLAVVAFVTCVLTLVYLQLTQGSPPRPEPKPDLSIITIAPQPSTALALGGSKQSIMVEFNKPVDFTTVIVSSSPDLGLEPIKSLTNSNQLILKVNKSWVLGQKYTISVSANILSVDHMSVLKQGIIIQYNITTSTPINIPAPGPDT